MPVRLSTHYYVICLSKQTNTLLEAFRDTLIDIRNQGFPINAPVSAGGSSESADQSPHVAEFLRDVDQHFGHYYAEEPLAVVVTGEEELLTLFVSVTAHKAAIVGQVDGDFTATSLRDLGKIVWPLVKQTLSGTREMALRDLENAADGRKICGIEAVSRRVNAAAGATLLVEEDYHVRGSISEADGSEEISPNVDVRDEIDDVVDILAEKVLGAGGNVVFLPGGSLRDLGRIVLLLGDVESRH